MKLKEQINIIYGEIKKNEKNHTSYLLINLKIIMLKKQLIN